ncbi:MAG: hypothetical protein KME64_35315 [Scytonematopsis contorta HA4267-MV1]|jgi:uncharacterized membrane protein YfcA|nr:hypothetical protein [Scytonematopsis contorta HA4267-MV1]
MKTYHSVDNDSHNSDSEEQEHYVTPKYKKRSLKENTNIAGLMIVGTGLMLTDISIHNMAVASGAFAAAIIALLPKEANSLLTNFETWQRKYKINIYTIVFCFVGVIFVLDMASAPANAQFLKNAEDFFKDESYFPGIDPQITGFIFAVLRGLFLLYLGISLVQVVQKSRNDEDWQTIARTPIIVAITVVVGDVLAGLVVGTGGGGGGGGTP